MILDRAFRAALFALAGVSLVVSCASHSPSVLPGTQQDQGAVQQAAPVPAASGFSFLKWPKKLPSQPTHRQVSAGPLGSTPSPNPTIGTDFVWINANTNYDEGAILQTNNTQCKKVHYSLTTTIPNFKSNYYYSPNDVPPNQTVVLSMYQVGPTYPPGIYSQTGSGTCSPSGGTVSKTASIAVEQIDWYDPVGKKTVTRKTLTTFAGADANLQIVTNPVTALVPEPYEQYNIFNVTNAPLILSSYTQTYTSGVPAYFFSGYWGLQSNFSFYWGNSNAVGSPLGGTQPTTFGVIASVPAKTQGDDVLDVDNSLVQVIYNVLGPTNVKMTSTTGNVMIAANPFAHNHVALSFGQIAPPGIYWTFTATGPKGASGNISAIQLVSTRQSETAIPGATPIPDPADNTNGISLLDAGKLNYFIYDGLSTPLPSGTTAVWSSSDSPYRDLTSLSYFQRADQFQTWFEYNPNTSNSIWIPLGYVKWNWAGTATLTGGSWVLSGVSASPNPAATIPNSYTQIPMPAWSGHIQP